MLKPSESELWIVGKGNSLKRSRVVLPADSDGFSSELSAGFTASSHACTRSTCLSHHCATEGMLALTFWFCSGQEYSTGTEGMRLLGCLFREGKSPSPASFQERWKDSDSWESVNLKNSQPSGNHFSSYHFSSYLDLIGGDSVTPSPWLPPSAFTAVFYVCCSRSTCSLIHCCHAVVVIAFVFALIIFIIKTAALLFLPNEKT